MTARPPRHVGKLCVDVEQSEEDFTVHEAHKMPVRPYLMESEVQTGEFSLHQRADRGCSSCGAFIVHIRVHVALVLLHLPVHFRDRCPVSVLVSYSEAAQRKVVIEGWIDRYILWYVSFF